ncbi:calcium-binding protein [Aerobium aerolatum]|uniref:Hemolysin-type calcium-binding repeat-containing protein n=1 Tax=Aquamicrobium aerolatum DSM 21857 TaxID=1121003 RepID=A0A1I3SWG5_9HYPH|nr:hypothetical protein [Aquamicrobium aerolatum]SFJ63204.1 hypothetical protein SAMN03080618_03503 [Aquamicrobium aerolatum DSM 21857]
MALTHLSFDATYYMTERPDVLTAYVNAGAETGTGMNWAQFAEQHYNDFGWKEGYNPNAIFDTSEYLAANIDVLNAGVNPFQHYLQFGAYEKRAPSDSFISFEDFDWETYLGANSDLTDAGIETAEDAYGHYVLFGQFEVRDGKPEEAIPSVPGETYTLTTGVDAGADFTGTADNDTFRAFDMDGPSGTAGATLQSWDILDGGAGVDTLNIATGAAADNAAPTLRNIEIINNAHLGQTINLASATGVQQIWTDMTGFTGTAATRYNDASVATIFGIKGAEGSNSDVNITFADSLEGDTTVNFALEGNAAGSYAGFYLEDEGVENAVITVAEGNGGFTTVSGVSSVTASGAGDFGFYTWDNTTIESFNASAVTGDVYLTGAAGGTAAAFDEDANISSGAGNDRIYVGNSDGALTISTGAGNDIIVSGSGNDTIIAGAGKNDLTGGLGEDTFVLDIKGTVLGSLDVINDFNFGDAQDTLVFGETELTNDNFASVGIAVSYNDLRELAQGAFSDDVSFVAGTFGADTYVFHDADADGVADAAVKLIGTGSLLGADAFEVAAV